MKKCKLVFITSIVALVLSTGNIFSAVGGNIGVRGGYDFDGDQGVIGFQSELGKFIELTRFAPSADYGFGGDMTTFAFKGDIRIYLTPPNSSATLYGGVGPTFFVVDTDGSDTDSKLGLTLSGGIKFSAGKDRVYNIEGRFGIDDMPDFRLLFGIYF
jgi:hypothetical protein